MKKIFTAIIFIIMVFSITGCGMGSVPEVTVELEDETVMEPELTFDKIVLYDDDICSASIIDWKTYDETNTAILYFEFVNKTDRNIIFLTPTEDWFKINGIELYGHWLNVPMNPNEIISEVCFMVHYEDFESIGIDPHDINSVAFNLKCYYDVDNQHSNREIIFDSNIDIEL